MRKLSWWKTSISVLVLIMAGLPILFFWNEWRVEREWQRYEEEARERGVKLLLTEFAASPIPEEENFAALPMWKAVFTQKPAPDPFKLPDPPAGTQMPPTFGDPIKGESIDLAAWQNYFQKVGFLKETSSEPARDVLSALDHFAPQFEEWNSGLSRPRCRFPLDLAKGAEMPLPHLSVFTSNMKLLMLRMQAHQALGDTTAALVDFRAALRSYHCLTNEPTLISGLVRISMLRMVISAVGDGLKAQVWKDGELKDIQAALGEVRLCPDYRLAMGSEHGFVNSVMDSIVKMSVRQRGEFFTQLSSGGTGSHSSSHYNGGAFALIPRSVFRQNQLRANRYMDELVAKADMTNSRFDPNLATPSALSANADWERMYYFAYSILTSAYGIAAERYVFAQTRLDQARLACALERRRLARGSFPETLNDLIPEFIEDEPRDPYARAPYHYQRLEGKSFLLYGVGENGRDDGGAIDRGKKETHQPDDVWLYAPANGA